MPYELSELSIQEIDIIISGIIKIPGKTSHDLIVKIKNELKEQGVRLPPEKTVFES